MTQPVIETSECALHEPFALQVLGPDMAPEFPDKSIIIIDPIDYCRSGMYIFVEVEGVRWFRQYRRDEEGRETLRALDEQFPTIDLTGLEWKVLGVIIQRKIRRKSKQYDYPDAGELCSVGGSTGGEPIDAVDITAAS